MSERGSGRVVWRRGPFVIRFSEILPSIGGYEEYRVYVCFDGREQSLAVYGDEERAIASVERGLAIVPKPSPWVTVTGLNRPQATYAYVDGVKFSVYLPTGAGAPWWAAVESSFVGPITKAERAQFDTCEAAFAWCRERGAP